MQLLRSDRLWSRSCLRPTTDGDTSTYRPEIDGLRAISVLLVIAFHFGMPGLSGGFIGVDVFFVISGYLITDIILREMEEGTFTVIGFYERRMKRIFPALLTMIVVTLAGAVFFLTPGDYATVARSAIRAVLSVSNIFFYRHTGYFDQAAELQPMLHTWSLGVEEQFYFVWPLLLLAIFTMTKGKQQIIAGICACLALGSFVWSVDLMSADPKAAFYLAHARSWELGAGALVAIAPRRWFRCHHLLGEAMPIFGLALIIVSGVKLDISSPFPGVNALSPVVGAAFIVAPWTCSTTMAVGLSARPLVLIGKISYSLYLWHWPILVLYKHYSLGAQPGLLDATALLLGIFSLSWLSWRFVELPARRSRLPRWSHIGAGLGTATAVAGLSLIVETADGFPQRIQKTARGMQSLAAMWEWNCPQSVTHPYFGNKAVCAIGAPWHSARERGVIWGDSHAQHYAPLLDKPARDRGLSVLLFPGICLPIVTKDGVQRHFPKQPTYNQQCSERRGRLLSFLRSDEDVSLLMLAAAWQHYPVELYINDPPRSRELGVELMQAGLDRLMDETRRPGLHTIVLSDVALQPNVAIGCIMATSGVILRRDCTPSIFEIPRERVEKAHAATNAIIRALPERWSNVSAIMVQDFMCSATACMTILNGEFLYRDSGHIRRNLKRTTQERLAELLRLGEALDRASHSQTINGIFGTAQ
jgi:peptidoglycan/LPS O-acetylase OafA/YrhL